MARHRRIAVPPAQTSRLILKWLPGTQGGEAVAGALYRLIVLRMLRVGRLLPLRLLLAEEVVERWRFRNGHGDGWWIRKMTSGSGSEHDQQSPVWAGEVRDVPLTEPRHDRVEPIHEMLKSENAPRIFG